MKESLLSLLLCLGILIPKENPPLLYKLPVFVLPKPYVDLYEGNHLHMCLVVALSFIKFCDPSEISFHTCLIKITYTPHAKLLYW
jgi:hypothetical protein